MWRGRGRGVVVVVTGAVVWCVVWCVAVRRVRVRRGDAVVCGVVTRWWCGVVCRGGGVVWCVALAAYGGRVRGAGAGAGAPVVAGALGRGRIGAARTPEI
jgi:hypothetical protein